MLCTQAPPGNSTVRPSPLSGRNSASTQAGPVAAGVARRRLGG